MPNEQGWLSSNSTAGARLNAMLLADVLRDYRREHHLNQADLAQILNLDQSYISKIERGQRQVRDVELLLRIAQQLNLPPREVGISPDLLRTAVEVSPESTSVGPADPVRTSQEQWLRARRHLNHHRGELARTAATLYQPDARIGAAPFLADDGWIPDAPIPLDDIDLEWVEERVQIEVSGTEPEADTVLPLRAPGHRFSRYTSAIRYLNPPSLFENRPSYRLLDVSLDAHGKSRMTFGLGTYFDKLDVSEAVAHELALAAQQKASPDWSDLPLRCLVTDPFQLRRRAVMPAIETLTLRRDRATGAASFLLHWRDPAKVATAAGIYGLIPAGEFQPSSIASWDRENDFSLWRNMVREFSEELLGEPERDGSQGQPLDYDSWPLYRTLQDAMRQNRVAAYCLGVGLDTLTLTATILTVVVMDDDVFDSLFGRSVSINAEGVLVTAAESSSVSDGIPYTEDSVHRLLNDEPMASPGACILARSWAFRDHLLGVR